MADSPALPEEPSTAIATPAEKPASGRKLTDNRVQGDWRTRYPSTARWHIAVELVYLGTGLIICLALLYQIAVCSHSVNGPKLWENLFVGASRSTLSLAAVAISGACGGFAFALKWLYHSVAYGWWNQDRLVWRIVVPLLSGTLAFFTALMIGSGLVPILSPKITEGPRTGAAFGFFVGFFSDNLLAALQRLADQTLGTLGRIENKSERQPEP